MAEEAVLRSIYEKLLENVEIKNRSYHLQTFKNCFIASEAIDYLVNSGIAKTRDEAVELISALEDQGLVYHVTRDHKFQDGNYYFRFVTEENSKGKNLDRKWSHSDKKIMRNMSSVGSKVTKKESDVITPSEGSVKPEVDEFIEREMDLEVSPLDEYNKELLNLVKPRSWQNPDVESSEKSKNFTLVVIGAGAGGLISAIQGAGLGLRTAIIEKHLLGGDCLNVGCVPSKALIRCAKAIKEVKNCNTFGVDLDTSNMKVDFGKIMERMRKLRSEIAPADSAERYTKIGCHVFLGQAKFLDKSTVEITSDDGEGNEKVVQVKFSKCIIATGGRAAVPPIPGIEDVNYLTNASLFNLTELPERFAVIGSGPIGSEMAQAFANFGSKVFVFDAQDKILPREDRDAAKLIQSAMEKDGVQFFLGASINRVYQRDNEKTGKSEIVIYFRQDNTDKEILVDSLLVSAGRKPNVENLNLEGAEVEYSKAGIKVKDGLQTTNSNIYAVGDVACKYQFTHMADATAKVAFRNAMFPFTNEKVSKLIVPWCTYTSPEVAHVGAYEHELGKKGIEYQVFTTSFAHNDRAILEASERKTEDNAGFVKLIIKKGTDTILGSTIVHHSAGELISQFTVAMNNKIGARALSGTIVPYPTCSDAIKRVCGEVNKQRLKPSTKRLLRGLVGLKKLGS